MIILDRYEGEWAVLETDDGIKSVPLSLLKEKFPVGSVLLFSNGEYILEEKETKTRREKLIGLQDSLF